MVKSCGIELPRPAEWTTALWRQYMKVVREEERDRLADRPPAAWPASRFSPQEQRERLLLAHKYLNGINHSGFDRSPPVVASHSSAALSRLAQEDHALKQIWKKGIHPKPLPRPRPSKAAPPPPPPLPPPPGQYMQPPPALRPFSSTDDAREAGTALLLRAYDPLQHMSFASVIGERAQNLPARSDLPARLEASEETAFASASVDCVSDLPFTDVVDMPNPQQHTGGHKHSLHDLRISKKPATSKSGWRRRKRIMTNFLQRYPELHRAIQQLVQQSPAFASFANALSCVPLEDPPSQSGSSTAADPTSPPAMSASHAQ
ncbi:hypothetical protein OC845_002764 [Tilletia horrida]|nr:hypothetical protein OC845_002764 [Tilletia horrida]